MTTDIAMHEHRGTLVLAGDQTDWTPVQRAALEHIGIADAPPADQQVFMHVCQRTGLDPFARQIYMIPRREGPSQNAKIKWTIQASIDGLRAKAEERPQYRGQIGPQWCGDDGVWCDVWVSSRPPAAARVGILRDDFHEPVWGVAMYREYVQTTTWNNETKPTRMWQQKAAHMTAKCAEALALRRAFPEQLSGVYTDDELGHLDNPAPRRVRTVVDAQPVTVAELTGTPTPARADSPPSPARTAPAAAAPPTPQGPPLPTDTDHTGGEGAGPHKPSQEQMRKLFALIREADIEDRMTYASGLLNRDISSYGQLTAADAHQLIDNLEAIVSDEGDRR